MKGEGYDVALICINGHVVNSCSISSPQFNKNHCKDCGAETINTCQNCNSKIKGHYHRVGYGKLGGLGYIAPKFCDNCGHGFPWTTEKLETSKQIIELADELSASEKQELNLNIEELIKDSPKVQLAQLKVKRLLSKTSNDISEGIHQALADIISKTIQTNIWK
jgi:hypothetical protein